MEITNSKISDGNITKLVSATIEALKQELNYDDVASRYNLNLEKDKYVSDETLIKMLNSCTNGDKDEIAKTIKAYVLSKCFNWDHYMWTKNVCGEWYNQLINLLQLPEKYIQLCNTLTSYVYRNHEQNQDIKDCLKEFENITASLTNTEWDINYCEMYQKAHQLVSDYGITTLLNLLNSNISDQSKWACENDVIYIELIIGYSLLVNNKNTLNFFNQLK